MQRTYCKLSALRRTGLLKDIKLISSRFYSQYSSSRNINPVILRLCSRNNDGNRIWTKYLFASGPKNLWRHKSKLAASAEKHPPEDDSLLEEVKVNSDNHIINTITSDNNNPEEANDNKSGVTIFMKNQQRLIDLKYGEHFKEEFSIFLPKSGKVVDVNIRDRLQCDLDDRVDPTLNIPGRPPSLQSTDEFRWSEQKLDVSKLPGYYIMLSKSRLTALIVLTAMGGYAMAPGAFEVTTFMWATLGTGLMSCSANALNMFFEVPYDSQMNRTKNRVLVRGLISPLHAVNFAVVSGVLGYSVLFIGANPLTASLGLFNLILYSCLYTPMKRYTVYNTWIGAVVGAIPPMMGWAACTGHLEPGAWLLGAMLFAWQFPHFNALSWNLRADYSRGGYRMMSVVEPDMCKRVAFRYCLVMTGLCLAAPSVNMTTWMFAADSLPLNLYLSYLGYRFYKDGDAKSSRNLFRFSLLHIPILFTLLLISKDRSWKESKEVKDPLLESVG